jgi:hypothetical protein
VRYLVCDGSSMCTVLVRMPETKTQFRRSRHKWEDNTKMDFSKIVLESVYWIHVAQDRD